MRLRHRINARIATLSFYALKKFWRSTPSTHIYRDHLRSPQIRLGTVYKLESANMHLSNIAGKFLEPWNQCVMQWTPQRLQSSWVHGCSKDKIGEELTIFYYKKIAHTVKEELGSSCARTKMPLRSPTAPKKNRMIEGSRLASLRNPGTTLNAQWIHCRRRVGARLGSDWRRSDTTRRAETIIGSAGHTSKTNVHATEAVVPASSH